ncbi:hypothetical protein chiPu_0023318 [Chiloscyllium punctatum]|uniref:Uncharacterized protein n=1 Tax=Chiloscyllium punctatum TaxID=137246 RepID=A0A401T866_CHIPU|nr:hypothetical protein [Chiloscyllium punctatum]
MRSSLTRRDYNSQPALGAVLCRSCGKCPDQGRIPKEASDLNVEVFLKVRPKASLCRYGLCLLSLEHQLIALENVSLRKLFG